MFNSNREDDIWESISDVMTGLMMVFLFVAIAYMYQLEQAENHIMDTKKEIMAAIALEFKPEELQGMGAKIDYESGKVIFDAQPDVNFDVGKADIKPGFKKILNEFFPKYIKVLTDSQYADKIAGIKIEGSASFESSADSAYFRDMRLSQDRASNVLQYVYYIPAVADKKEWIRKHVSANGLSYANANKIAAKEDRKVEFSFRTKDEEWIKKMKGQVTDYE